MLYQFRLWHMYTQNLALVVMKNKIAISNKLILRRIDDQSFSLIGFNQFVINGILSNYSTHTAYKYATLVVASDIIFIYIIVS